jgi:hypothetical protein
MLDSEPTLYSSSIVSRGEGLKISLPFGLILFLNEMTHFSHTAKDVKQGYPRFQGCEAGCCYL